MEVLEQGSDQVQCLVSLTFKLSDKGSPFHDKELTMAQGTCLVTVYLEALRVETGREATGSCLVKPPSPVGAGERAQRSSVAILDASSEPWSVIQILPFLIHKAGA